MESIMKYMITAQIKASPPHDPYAIETSKKPTVIGNFWMAGKTIPDDNGHCVNLNRN